MWSPDLYKYISQHLQERSLELCCWVDDYYKPRYNIVVRLPGVDALGSRI